MPCSRRNAFCGAQYNGGVAQLGERVNGIHEVRGSIPLASTARAAKGGRGRQGAVDKDPTERLDWRRHAGIAQLVEHNLAKVGVAGSSPVSRSPRRRGVEQSGSCPGLTPRGWGVKSPPPLRPWGFGDCGWGFGARMPPKTPNRKSAIRNW